MALLKRGRQHPSEGTTWSYDASRTPPGFYDRTCRVLAIVCSVPYPNRHRHVNKADKTDGRWYVRIDQRWRAVVEMDFARKVIVVLDVVHRKDAYK